MWFQHTHPQIRRTLDVADPPDAAFRRAVDVMMRLGGTLWQQDAQSRTLQAFLNNGTVRLDVTVHATGRGSQLQVSHQTLPTYFVAGDDETFSDDFLVLYTQHDTRR